MLWFAPEYPRILGDEPLRRPDSPWTCQLRSIFLYCRNCYPRTSAAVVPSVCPCPSMPVACGTASLQPPPCKSSPHAPARPPHPRPLFLHVSGSFDDCRCERAPCAARRPPASWSQQRHNQRATTKQTSRSLYSSRAYYRCHWLTSSLLHGAQNTTRRRRGRCRRETQYSATHLRCGIPRRS